MWGEVWVRRRGLQALFYALPAEAGPYKPGMRLLVPLGARNIPHLGLLMAVTETLPLYAAKDILQRLDAEPLYDAESLAFFRWLVSYYLSTPGDVAYLALPGRIGSIYDWEAHWTENGAASANLRPKKLIAQLRQQAVFSLRQASRAVGRPPKKLLTLLRQWEKAGALQLRAVVRQTVRRPPSLIQVAAPYQEANAFQAAWEKVEPSLQPLFLELLQRTLRGEPLSYAHLLRREGRRLRVLLRAGLVERIPARDYYQRLYARPLQPYTLTPAQQAALEKLRAALTEKPTRPVLLHGVTASGKTFLYLELMRQYLQAGRQVLYLLPEIALTKQTLDRLRATFGEAMELYHSSLTEAERFRIWRAVREDAVDVLVGTRSALFLPFHRLGLIIVDEEHEASYGQEGRPPLYQARDAAVYYAQLRRIPIVLGSATPALESYANALQGKYALVSLLEKALPSTPPTLEVVDMRLELRERLSTGVFSSVLRERIEENLGRGQQVILFRNRRGYAPMLLCQTCGHRWECPDCALTLTYHKYSHSLVCHYCGYRERLPARCGVCGSDKLSLSGIGTERVEEQLRQFFPSARVLRLDRDTAGSWSHEAIIAAFERGQADILIGTQMVTKGLDFERVTLVGVLYADSLLGRTDFRAEERAYQLLVQLMGRAGRRGMASHVVIQTFKPETRLFQQLHEPYEAWAEASLAHRKRYGYPPFRRLLAVNLFHKETSALEVQAHIWAQALSQWSQVQILGPAYAEIPRLKGRYHMQILLKLPPKYAYQALREGLLRLRQAQEKRWGAQVARVSFHVDP